MKIFWTKTHILKTLSEKLDDNKEYHLVYSDKETKELKSRYQEQFYYWLFWDIEKQTPFSADTIKQYILWRVFWKELVFWELINRKTKTSKLLKSEAWDLINWIQTFCIENSINMKYTSRDLKSLYLTYN